MLRRYGKAIGLPPGFTIHDRADAEDLMNVVRTELGLAKTDQRFPKKGTCMDIYSRCVNAREKLESALVRHFPWCLRMGATNSSGCSAATSIARRLAACSITTTCCSIGTACWKTRRAGPIVRGQFDCVLVDEYQDTNRLQAEIVYRLSPEGKGVTVVGDDAAVDLFLPRGHGPQYPRPARSSYPGTKIVTLEQNYRSTQPILDATNRVIALAERTLRQESLVRSPRGANAGAGHVRRRGRAGGLS